MKKYKKGINYKFKEDFSSKSSILTLNSNFSYVNFSILATKAIDKNLMIIYIVDVIIFFVLLIFLRYRTKLLRPRK